MIRFLQSGNKAAKYLLGGLLVILCGSMVTYLIPGFMSGSTVDRGGVVASVGGVEISTQDVQKQVDMMMQQAARNGQHYPDAIRPYLLQQAVPQLIRDAELRYEGDRMGLKVSDQELSDALHGPSFAEAFFPQGQWVGQDRYEQIVQQYWGTTVDDFERQVRYELLMSKVLTAATAGVTVAPAEIEHAYKDQNTKVKFDYAVISMDDVQKQINPTDTELKAYYDANKARYQNSIPEKRQVRYFVITEQQAQNKVAVTPADIEQYYRSHDAEYRVPDRVKVRHILISVPKGPDSKADPKALDTARAKAEDILKQVKAGRDFAELAKKNSDDPGSKDEGGELGWIVKGQTVAEFEKSSFSMDKGQISDLVQTTFGFHIIQTEEKETAHKKSLTEVKDSIEAILKPQKVAAWLDQTANSAEADARKQGLEQAAAKYGSPVTATGPIARTETLAGVGPAPDVMSDIFNTSEKDGVKAAQAPHAYVIFAVQKIVPPATPAFEAIKDRVASDFKTERSGALLTQKAAELSDRARASHDLRKAAKELGATVKSSNLVGRSDQVPDIGAMSGPAAAAFGMKPGEISTPLETGRNGVVLAITDRQEPSLTGDDFAKAKDGLREQLTQSKRQEAQQLFINNLDERLKKQGKVKTNNATLDGLLKSGRG